MRGKDVITVPLRLKSIERNPNSEFGFHEGDGCGFVGRRWCLNPPAPAAKMS